MNEIEKVLQKIYDPSLEPPPALPPPAETPSAQAEESLTPFAKVDGVAPESPAAQAVCSLSFQVAPLDA